MTIDNMNETEAQRKARIEAEIEAAWMIREAQKRAEIEQLAKTDPREVYKDTAGVY
jgi:hypothetical protein